MHRALTRIFVLATGVMVLSSEGLAQSKRVVSFAFTNEITYEPYVYAIRKGIVNSTSVEMKLLPTAIPALLQATGTKQFDLIETSPLGLAQGISRGLDARIAGTAGIVRGGRFVFVKETRQSGTRQNLKESRWVSPPLLRRSSLISAPFG